MPHSSLSTSNLSNLLCLSQSHDKVRQGIIQWLQKYKGNRTERIFWLSTTLLHYQLSSEISSPSSSFELLFIQGLKIETKMYLTMQWLFPTGFKSICKSFHMSSASPAMVVNFCKKIFQFPLCPAPQLTSPEHGSLWKFQNEI